MLKLLVLLSILLSLAAVACRGGAVRRPLRELGHVTLPERLEPYPAQETPWWALHPFDRTALWPMGSSRPVSERLVLAVWTPASRTAAREAAIRAAAERTDSIVWRDEGVHEIGEGVHEVNASSYPAWLVVRDVEAQGLTVAYMAWKKTRSLAEARRAVDDAARSFEPALAVPAYLALAQERPARERREREQAVRAALAARGVALALDGGPVEHDGRLWELRADEHRGPLLVVLHPLGALPRAAGYRHLRPDVPAEAGRWAEVTWLEHEAGRWVGRAVDDELLLGPAIVERAGRRHADAADRAHFYASHVWVLDAMQHPEYELAWFDRTAPRMAALFAAGELVR